jgi:hypothetical protein
VEFSTLIASRDYPAHETSALPGGKGLEGLISPDSRSWQDTIGISLPPREALDALIDQFFNSVNWFMMAITIG